MVKESLWFLKMFNELNLCSSSGKETFSNIYFFFCGVFMKTNIFALKEHMNVKVCKKQILASANEIFWLAGFFKTLGIDI